MKLFKNATALLAILATASLVGHAAPPASESAGQYIDDTVITTKVKAAILEEPSLKSSEITVETYKGVVQLSGFVRSQENVNLAVTTATAIKGVTSVKNDMRLK